MYELKELASPCHVEGVTLPEAPNTVSGDRETDTFL